MLPSSPRGSTAPLTTLDYRPNLTARSLRSSDGRTRTIGVVLEDVANPFSSSLHRAVEDIASARGVAVFAGSVDEDPERERALALALIARRVDGLIVVPAGEDQSYLANEQRAGLNLVFADRPPACCAPMQSSPTTPRGHGQPSGT